MNFMMNSVFIKHHLEFLIAFALSRARNEDSNSRIRMDVLWHELEKEKYVNGNKKFILLALIAKLVLTLPHSNADEERVLAL